MVIVDGHCHALPHWYEPVEVLVHQMDANGVERAALVQVRGQFDNAYILDCLRRFPGRFCAVVAVDTCRPDAADTLERCVEDGAVGVRLDASARSPGSDPLAIWRAAARLGIAVSAWGSADDFMSGWFERVLIELPELPVVIEHLGGIGRAEPPPYPRFRRILALARHRNAYMKLHGLGEICRRPMPFPEPMRFEDVPPFMDMACDAFRPERVMWGSDFPPVAGREGYRNALRWPMDHLGSRGDADREWIFGRTALSVFRFGGE